MELNPAGAGLPDEDKAELQLNSGFWAILQALQPCLMPIRWPAPMPKEYGLGLIDTVIRTRQTN